MISTNAPKLATEADREIGSRIAAVRAAQGLSQTALGQAIGVSFQLARPGLVAQALAPPAGAFVRGPGGRLGRPAAGPAEVGYLSELGGTIGASLMAGRLAGPGGVLKPTHKHGLPRLWLGLEPGHAR
jgi:hypothetical protein